MAREFDRGFYFQDDVEEPYSPAPVPGKIPVTARLTPPAASAPVPFDVAAAWGTVLQRKELAGGIAPDAGEKIDRAAGSPGVPLPDGLRARFEVSLGTDLSGVRVHAGGESAEAARAVSARAYTLGQDIHFGAGAYDPGSEGGQRLIAHEVAHTVQQAGSTSAPARKEIDVSAPGDALERDADRAADSMVAGRPAMVAGGGQGIARDFDDDMQKAGQTAGDVGANDVRVQVIMDHTTVADESEAKALIQKIDQAREMVERHPEARMKGGDGLGPMKGLLVENVDARFVLEEYLATVTRSGEFQSQYAASYMHTKRDYGEFLGLWQAFSAAGGNLEPGAHKAKMAALSADPEFLRARTRFQDIRNELKTDHNALNKGLHEADEAKSGLLKALYTSRAVAGRATADKKKKELEALKQSINDAVSTIMTVGQIAAMATTGMLTLGAGADVSQMIEDNPEIAPPPPGTPAPSPMAPPDVSKFTTPGTDLNPHGTASPEDGLGKPNDTRSYRMPSQAVATAKSAGTKLLGGVGGPKELLQKALTMLEQSNIDKLQGQIDAANEEGKLNEAAQVAVGIKEQRSKYLAKMEQLVNHVGNLLDHKKQMDTEVNAMVAAAKKHGAGKDLTGALRIVAAGDKFLGQVDLTIGLGQRQQIHGREARAQRYQINGGPLANTGTAQGPNQLVYWTVRHDGQAKEFVATKHRVELQASGKDSLASDDMSNSTQFDVGKSVEELERWKIDVQNKRDVAQNSLGIGVAAGKSSD